LIFLFISVTHIFAIICGLSEVLSLTSCISVSLLRPSQFSEKDIISPGVMTDGYYRFIQIGLADPLPTTPVVCVVAWFKAAILNMADRVA
jgi:hypothetical protein